MLKKLVRTLIEIHSSLMNSGIKYGTGSRFRVRDINTLEDYAVFGAYRYSPYGRPTWYKALHLDGCNSDIVLAGDEYKFVLLSSAEECCYLSVLAFSYFDSILASSYREGVLSRK